GLVIHSLIGTLELDPATKSLHGIFPLGTRFHHQGAALFDIVRDGNLRADIFLGFDPKLLVHHHLGRQTMTLPAPASLNSLALHRIEPAHSIFHGRNEQVSMVWSPRQKWRPIVEYPLVVDRSVLDRCIKRSFFFPCFRPLFFILKRSTTCS